MFPVSGPGPNNPLKFPVRVGDTLLTVPITGPQEDVQGFQMPAGVLPTQGQVDQLATKFQSFYELLPTQEQSIMAALLAQAAAYAQ